MPRENNLLESKVHTLSAYIIERSVKLNSDLPRFKVIRIKLYGIKNIDYHKSKGVMYLALVSEIEIFKNLIYPLI